MSEKSGANADEASADEAAAGEERKPLPLKKWRACDDLPKLRQRVHRAMRSAEVAMYAAGEEGDRAGVLKAATTLQQTARTYLKVLEADELEERITALEEAFEEQQEKSPVLNGRARYN